MGKQSRNGGLYGKNIKHHETRCGIFQEAWGHRRVSNCLLWWAWVQAIWRACSILYMDADAFCGVGSVVTNGIPTTQCVNPPFLDLFGGSNPCFTAIFSNILKSAAKRSQWHSCFYPKVGTIFLVIWNYPILSIHVSGANFLSHAQLSCWRVICMPIARGT